MDFLSFQRLYKGDPIVLHLAMELWLRQGKTHISSSSVDDLVRDLKLDLSGFFTERKLRETVETVKELASLDASTLIGYIKRAASLSSVDDKAGKEQLGDMCATLKPSEADGRTLSIDLSYAVLESSIMLPAPEEPIEIAFELVFPNGGRQDLALVRPLDHREGCEILVWRDPEEEYYTDSIQIPARKTQDI